MWQNTSEGNGGTDKSIKLFVSADCELEVAGSDALDLEIFGGVLQHGLALRVRQQLG